MKERRAQLPPLVPRYVSLARAISFIANPIPILSENLRKYGRTYRFHIGGFKKGIVTVEPEVIQHILQKNNRNYRKSEIQTGTLAHYVGRGLLTSEGDYWLRQRRLIQPGFHKNRLSELVQIINDEISNTVISLRSTATGNGILDVYQTMHQLAFRIVAKTLFSTGLNEQLLEDLSDQITNIQKFIVKEIRQPYAHLWHKLSGQKRKSEMLADSTRKILTSIIEMRLASGQRSDDLLQMLLDTRYEDTGEGMTLEQLIDECLILFVAGHETSANALTWTFHLLSEHPDKIGSLLSETANWSRDGLPTFETLQKIPYTSQVIEESLRMFPPAWIIDRVAIENDEIAGYKIPRNTMVVLFIYGTHYDQALWDRPHQFIPERFAAGLKKDIVNFAYFPFGGGPRLCIGNNFAMMEMQLVLTRLIREFSFTKTEAKDASLHPLITLRPAGGLNLKIQLREPRAT